MKNRIMLAAVLIILVLLAAGFRYEANTAKWEFKVMTIRAGGDKYDTDTLDGAGLSGWELVAIERDGGDRTYFFKRPK
jgi:hypothetical protein